MTEELTFEKKYKDRIKYTRYNVDHDSNSFFIRVRYMKGAYTDYEINSTITINIDIPDTETLDKIEKEALRLFEEAYNFSTYKKAYKLIAVILLLLIRYKIIDYRQLTRPYVVQISYEVITRRNNKRTYDLETDDFITLVKKLDRFFKENKIYEKMGMSGQ